jgi:pyruvate dehydrogenase E2 component (dihydrolipoamide acetyltransferase)
MEKWAENLDEVTVGEWLKAEGDPVEVGEAVAELITEKATFKYEPEEGGVLLKIFAEDSSTVPVGYVIGYIGDPGEEIPATIEAENEALIQATKREARLSLDWPEGEIPTPAKPPAAGRVRATPPARRMARDAGIELEDVAAWVGESRRITDRDVQGYLEQRRNE